MAKTRVQPLKPVNIDKLLTAQAVTSNDLSNLTTGELRYFVAKAGKRVNQRLASIENAGRKNTPAYQWVVSQMRGRDKFLTTTKSTATTRGGRTIKQQTAGKRAKFLTNTRGMKRSTLLAEARQIQHFANLQTSTISGINTMFKNSLDTVNSKFKTNFTEAELDQIVSNNNFKAMLQFGSEQVLQLLSKHTDVAQNILDLGISTEWQFNKLKKLIEAGNVDFETISLEDLTIVNEVFGNEG